MTPTPNIHLPLQGIMAGFRRFTVAEYHRLIDIGILTEDDNLELIEGYLVQKMTRNPPHDETLYRVLMRLLQMVPPGCGWIIRPQSAVTLSDSEPEPDLAVVVAIPGGYRTRHPSAADVGLVIEVADSTLLSDRADKGRIYARAGIPVYWIVNVADGQIEVYTQPAGVAYTQRDDYRPGDDIPLSLGGQPVTTLPAAELLL